MTSKELIQKLDSHMRVNKITRKIVADKLGVTSSAVGRILSADNCGLHEFIRILDAVDLYKRSYIHTMRHFTLYCSSLGMISLQKKTQNNACESKAHARQ